MRSQQKEHSQLNKKLDRMSKNKSDNSSILLNKKNSYQIK